MKKLKSILLVESDTDFQNIFITALSEIQNTAIYGIAKNGKDALDKLESSVILPDLIFMNLNKDDVDGIKYMTDIINDSFLGKIPVVILSSSLSSSDKKLIQNFGAAAVIEK